MMTEDVEKVQSEAERAAKKLWEEAKQIPLKNGFDEEFSDFLVAVAIANLFMR